MCLGLVIDPRLPLPLFRCTTYNLNSASATTVSHESRRRNISSNLEYLSRRNDFICLQETNLGLHNTNYFKLISATRKCTDVHLQNISLGVGGGATIFSPNISKRYHILPPTRNAPRGIIISKAFSIDGISENFQVVNFHGAFDRKSRCEQFRFLLKQVRNDLFTYLVGDFNFLDPDSPPGEDGSVSGSHTLCSQESLLWRELTSSLRLTEIKQPSHTYYRLPTDHDSDKVISSRLDRIYITERPTDFSLYQPITHIPSIPHTSLITHRIKASSPGIAAFHKSSDHYPVSFTFHNSTPSKHRLPTIPKWIASSPAFASAFHQLWSHSASDFAAAALFKRCSFRAYRVVLGEVRAASSGDQIRVLSAAFKLMRLTLRGLGDEEPAQLLLQLHPELSATLCPHLNLPVLHLLRPFIDNLLVTTPSSPQLHFPEGSVPSQATNFILAVKNELPPDRKRLIAFTDYDDCIDAEILKDFPDRPKMGQGPVTAPADMSAMINFYWGPIWQRRKDQPSAPDVYNYLRQYLTRVPAALNPSTPSLSPDAICETMDFSWQELLCRVVNGSNNSCPGPDGIPFAAYRSLGGISTKFLLEVLILLANGTLPPPGFNVAHLFLIPKDDSGKVLSHRPIAVANAENRLVSFAIASVMGPACQAILHPAQKGFIPGRNGQEHVHEFADQFYGALNDQSQAYALFTDNRKAFDSIDHQYIHALLDTLGFSSWVARAIAMLYWCATLSPVLSEHTGVLLRVERGVKQGCPLSPLIFAICYDPLLQYLQPSGCVHPPLSLFAFADDLNIFSFSLASLLPSIKVIERFRHFSGLGINIDKCSILSTRTPHPLAYRAVSLSSWPLLKWVSDHTYLGVVFSREPSAEKVYERPLGRLRRKAGLYRYVFRSLPLHLCIVAANVFLVSLFSYIIQFYLPGSVVVEEVYSILRSLIIPFHGRAYTLPHLFLGPLSGFYGLPTPLRDLDGWALTTLANKVDLSLFHGQSSAIIPGFDPLDRKTFSSFRVSDHINYAVLDLTNRWLRSPASAVPPVAPLLVTLASSDVLSGVGLGSGATGEPGSLLGVGGGVDGGVVGGDGPISSSDLLANSSSVRKVLYRRYIRSYWGQGVDNPVDLLNGPTPISLSAKLGRWGLSAGHQACLHTRWAGPKFPKVPHLLAFHFRMLFNALPTDRRLSPIDSFTHTALHCYFCGLSDLTSTKSLDSIEHIYSGGCPVVSAAHKSFMSLFGPSFTLSLENSLLAYPLEPEPVRHRARLRWVSTLFFNHALFQLRRRLFMSRELAPPSELASRMLFESLRFDWNSFVSGYLKGKPFRIYRVSPLTNRLVHPLNDKSFPAKKKVSSAAVLGEIQSIPSGAHSFYTDGSANPNPGPCGAGVVHLVNGSIVQSFSVPLGRGTNNVGELYAAGVALSAMALVLEGSPDSHLTFYLLSDSSFVLDLLLGRSQLRSKLPALAAIYPSVKKLWRSLAARATLRALKVKGHSGLRWNDHADRLADSARKRSVPADGSRIELCAREGVFDLFTV